MKTYLTNVGLVEPMAAQMTFAHFAIGQLQTSIAKTAICSHTDPAVTACVVFVGHRNCKYTIIRVKLIRTCAVVRDLESTFAYYFCLSKNRSNYVNALNVLSYCGFTCGRFLHPRVKILSGFTLHAAC